MKELLSDSAKRLATDYAESDRIVFFDILRAVFSEAAAQAGSARDFYFSLGGQTIHLQFAGNALEKRLTRAMAHLRCPPPATAADLTIRLWDSSSTGRPLPYLLDNLLQSLYSISTSRHARGGRGEIFPLMSRRFGAALNGPFIFSGLDRAENEAFYYLPDHRELPDYEIGAPLKAIFHWWFSSPSRQLVHSGAVGNAMGGVLLVGEGGAGKSTTALNCLNSPLCYASDDYVLVETQPVFTVRSLYNTAKVKTNADLARFPNLASWHQADKQAAKPMMFVYENAPDKLIGEMPLKAVICPRYISGAQAALAEISPSEAFKAISISTIRQAPNAGSETMSMLRGLVSTLPRYSLVFGEQQCAVPEIIGEVLANL